MKAERRHELQENVLAHWLAQQIEAIKPHWQTIVAVLVVGLVALLAVNYFRGRASAKKSVGWDEYLAAVAANDLEELEGVTEQFPTATSSLWAQLMAADQRLVTGTNQLYSNADGARSDLEQAIDNYESVLERADHPMLIRLATFGLARAFEGRYERSKAIDAYQQLVDKYPDSAEAKVAERRIASLSKPSTKEFLAWFPKQDVKPRQLSPTEGRVPGGPGSGFGQPGSGMPGAESPLPSLGSLTDPLGIGGVAAGEPEDNPPTDGAAPAGETAPDGETAPASETAPDGATTPPDGASPAEDPTPSTAEESAASDEAPKTEPSGEPAPEPAGASDETTDPAADPPGKTTQETEADSTVEQPVPTETTEPPATEPPATEAPPSADAAPSGETSTP